MPDLDQRPFRAHDRRKAGLVASISHPLAGWRVEGKVIDLGLGGAALEFSELVERGDRLVVEMMAPTLWDPLHVRGRVAWTQAGRPSGVRCGVVFEHADAPSLFALFELLGTLEF